MATSRRVRRAPPRTREQLEDYRRKRDFEKTAEPSGDVETTKRPRGLTFVIQKHAASHLHYDLRLELNGVMRSWAVPKGPSIDPAARRLAMQVEDHPMAYNTFEGNIPKGEYGGGTVMLWDRGTYRPDEVLKGEDEETAVQRGLKAGKLSFTFEGERLRGSFALIRTERGPKPKWLLMKHRDDAASSDYDITEEVLTSVATGRTMAEIAAENDRVWRSNRGGRKGGEESGTATTDANVIAPMKPTPARALPKTGVWTYEPWRGGERVLAYVTPTGAQLRDESARDLTRKHRAIADSLARLAARIKAPFVLDGELARTGTDVVFHASDLLLHGDDVLMNQPWSERRTALAALFERRRVSHVALQDASDDGEAVIADTRTHGWPGVLARRADASYSPGRKSDALRRIAVH